MSARTELYRVVRDLKNYLRWQQAGGAAGSVPATADEREVFEAKKKSREQAKLDRIKASFQAETKSSDDPKSRAPSPEVSAPKQSAEPSTGSESTDTDPDKSSGSAKADFVPDFNAQSSEPRAKSPEAPAKQSAKASSPWKKIGSRPQRRFDASSAPDKSASDKSASDKSAPDKSAPDKSASDKSAPDKSAPNGKRASSKPSQAGKPKAKQMNDDQSRPFDDSRYPEAAGMMPEGTVEQPDDVHATPDRAPQKDEKPAKQMTKREKLDYLRDYLGDCRRCGLCEHRTNIAFGTGDAEAKLVFVGEAPGYNEDKQGEPFVGKAGQLLDKMIDAMGLSREQVYICNVIKCRPPDNRDPQSDEIRQCAPFLRKQLEAIEPDVVVTLGKFASQFVTGEKNSMGALRGKWHEWEGVAVMPTYHPAYLLRSADQKGKTWSDLQMVMEKLGLDGS